MSAADNVNKTAAPALEPPPPTRPRRLLPVILVILLSLIPLRSMLWMDDWSTHEQQQYSVRLAALSLAIDEGQSLGRWISVLKEGYGYPLFHYYPPGFYLLAAALFRAGLGLMVSIKVALALTQAIGALGMYGLGCLFFRRRVALACALLWAFLPYQQVNLFVRGAFAEFAALQWLAAALYFLLRYIRTRSATSLLGAAVAMALMVITHAITAMIGTALLAVAGGWFAMANGKGGRHGRWLFLAPMALGLALSAFYWVPAFGERGLVQTAKMVDGYFHYSKHFLYWPQWLNVFYWNVGPSIPGPNDSMPLHVGLAPLAFTGLGWWLVVAQRQKVAWPLACGTLGAIIALVLTTSLSRWAWDILPLMAYVQFPWRFLGEAGLMLALAGGSGLDLLLKKLPLGNQKLVATVALAFVILAPPWHWQPSYPRERILPERPTAEDLKAKTGQTTSVDEFLPRAVSEMAPPDFAGKADFASGSGTIRVLRGQTTRIQGTADQPSTIVYGEYWFPHLRLESKDATIASRPGPEPLGLIEFQVPSGAFDIAMTRGRTPMQHAGDGISILAMIAGLAGWGIGIWRSQRRRRL